MMGRVNMLKKFKICSLCLAFALASTVVSVGVGAAPVSAASLDTTDVTNLTCAQVVPLADGGTDYVYDINGVENTFPVPPAGFNPLKATDTQLAEYGFPARPKNGQDLADWNQEMKTYKSTPVPKVAKKNNSKNNVAQIASGSSSSIQASSTSYYNWGGYVDHYAANNTFASVQGDFTEPPCNSTISNTYECSWVGLGGYTSARLVQSGTEVDKINGSASYYAWYEYLGNGVGVNEITLPSLNVRAGDKIHILVSFESANNQLNCYVADNTSGTSQSVVVNLSAGTYYDGSTAEWIDERPTVNGSYSALTNYGSNSWTNCQAYLTSSSTWQALGSLTYDQVTMVQYPDCSYALSQPNALSSTTSFTDFWRNYQ